uniref:Uncharacterized protein n=1 Tax=Globodera rostochiensis TaxID=31243 RepID=A0A914HYM8_GLORO
MLLEMFAVLQVERKDKATHLAMSMEQLTEKFDLQLQLLDIEFEPAEFIDIDSREWCAERVKDRGTYKVVGAHP